MRVNARLDDESREQIEYLTAATGMGVSQVLRESVALYYRQARASASGARHLLALVGKGQSGRANIASDVKRHVTDALSVRAPGRPKPGSAPRGQERSDWGAPSVKHGVPTGAKRAGRRA